jgi:hypothetical protein
MKKNRFKAGVAMLVLFVLSTVVVVACKVSPGCIIADKAATAISSVIVSKAACKNPTAVRNGVLSWCNDDLGLCKSKNKTGVIADVVCPLIGEFGKAALAQKLTNSKILKDGECDPNVAADAIVGYVVEGCELLPF